VGGFGVFSSHLKKGRTATSLLLATFFRRWLGHRRHSTMVIPRMSCPVRFVQTQDGQMPFLTMHPFTQ
jgi:hypothetical protein